MSLRERVRGLVEQGELDAIDELVAEQPRAVRHLLALTYHADTNTRKVAARTVALASRHHPSLVQGITRRLVWAMNDESGTNALSAPAVIVEISRENPELLLPVVPDLIRLAGDEGLNEGLAEALSTIAEACPGKVGKGLQKSLNDRIRGGESNVG